MLIMLLMLLCEAMIEDEVRNVAEGQRMIRTEFERTKNKTSRRQTVMQQRKLMKCGSVCLALNIVVVCCYKMWGIDANVVILEGATVHHHASLNVFKLPIINKCLCPSLQIKK